jgi:phenylpropionate dioxygenase-like ring-hydroxylating dioxygenase large terminal subunit
MSDMQWRKTSKNGNAYGRPQQRPDDYLTAVGAGTPMGELLRRYWHPIALSARVQDLPRRVRILGEDLIVFRDKQGRAGLLYPRCMHRGTSLFFGKVEDRGIRCCYHGWLFDTEGRCLEQPCEPGGGKDLDAVRQPWYPVEERYGFVFAYLGPPEKRPVLPRYDVLEDVNEGEEIASSLGGLGSTGDTSLDVVPYSWLQMNDNVMDPFHVYVLHSTLTGPQFAAEFALLPEVKFFHSDSGVCYSALRELDGGRRVDRISSWIMPNIMSVPDIGLRPGKSTMMSWVVPVDDSHYVQAFAMRMPKGVKFDGIRLGGKLWGEMTEEEHQRWPGDFEAQAGQGAISLHSEEHLRTSDRGITMQRRMLRQQIEIVQKGGDPLNVVFDEAGALVDVPSGNFYFGPEPTASRGAA